MYEKIPTGYLMMWRHYQNFFMYEHGTMTALFSRSYFLLEAHTQIFTEEIRLGTCFKRILGAETLMVCKWMQVWLWTSVTMLSLNNGYRQMPRSFLATMCVQNCPQYTTGGNVIWCSCYGKHHEVPPKIKNGITISSNLTSGYLSKRIEIRISKTYVHCTSIVALFKSKNMEIT